MNEMIEDQDPVNPIKLGYCIWSVIVLLYMYRQALLEKPSSKL